MPRKIPRLELALQFLFGAIWGVALAAVACMAIWRFRRRPFEVPWLWVAILVPLGAVVCGWRAMRKGNAFWDERLG